MFNITVEPLLVPSQSVLVKFNTSSPASRYVRPRLSRCFCIVWEQLAQARLLWSSIETGNWTCNQQIM